MYVRVSKYPRRRRVRHESVQILNMCVNPRGCAWPSRCGSPVFRLLYASFTPPGRRQHRDNSLHVITASRFSGGPVLTVPPAADPRGGEGGGEVEGGYSKYYVIDLQTPEM